MHLATLYMAPYFRTMRMTHIYLITILDIASQYIYDAMIYMRQY